MTEPEIQPMPVPWTVRLSLIDVKHQDGTDRTEVMIPIEFHSFNGVAVYFANKENAQNLINGLGQMVKKMNKSPIIPVFKELPPELR